MRRASSIGLIAARHAAAQDSIEFPGAPVHLSNFRGRSFDSAVASGVAGCATALAARARRVRRLLPQACALCAGGSGDALLCAACMRRAAARRHRPARSARCRRAPAARVCGTCRARRRRFAPPSPRGRTTSRSIAWCRRSSTTAGSRSPSRSPRALVAARRARAGASPPDVVVALPLAPARQRDARLQPGARNRAPRRARRSAGRSSRASSARATSPPQAALAWPARARNVRDAFAGNARARRAPRRARRRRDDHRRHARRGRARRATGRRGRRRGVGRRAHAAAGRAGAVVMRRRPSVVASQPAAEIATVRTCSPSSSSTRRFRPTPATSSGSRPTRRTELHLVEPLGFRMDDRDLKRAGLDYHEYARVAVHRDFAACRARSTPARARRWFAFTTGGSALALRRAVRARRRARVRLRNRRAAGRRSSPSSRADARLRIPMRAGRAQPQPVERGRGRRLRSVAAAALRAAARCRTSEPWSAGCRLPAARLVHPERVQQEAQLVVAVDDPLLVASCRCRGRCRSPCTAGTATPGPDCSARPRRTSSRAADRRANRIRRPRPASPAGSRPRGRSGTASSAGSSGSRPASPGRRTRRSSSARSGTCWNRTMSSSGTWQIAARNRSGRCVMSAPTVSPPLLPPSTASFAGDVYFCAISHSATAIMSSNVVCLCASIALLVPRLAVFAAAAHARVDDRCRRG